MTIQTEEDLIKLKQIGKIVAQTIQVMGSSLEPGMTTKELDLIGKNFLLSQGARSAPELIYNFPGTTCISINHKIAHGIPSEEQICPGDMVNIDVSAEKDGYFADSGYSFIVPPIAPIKQALAKATRSTLFECLARVRAGMPINLIGKIITQAARRFGYQVIDNLGSHGIGRALHEDPEFIAPYYDSNDQRILTKGMVITIEPFLAIGASYAREAEDGWTLSIPKGCWAAQFEHSLVITDKQPIILTSSSLH